MEKITFAVSKRADQKPKSLRREGSIPANMYQAGKDSLALVCATNAFKKLYEEVGDTGLVYLKIDGVEKEMPVLIDEVQYDYKGQVLHVVFRKVNLKEKIKAEIPVELTGEFDIDNAVVVLVQDAVEVEALPTDLPEGFNIDQSILKEIGQTITLADLDFDKEKVTLVLDEDVQPEDVTLVSVQEKREEEPEEVIAEEPAEPERVGEKAEEASATEETKKEE